MISIPTFMAIPANTAMGIVAVKLLAQSTTINKIKARVKPDSAVRAPV